VRHINLPFTLYPNPAKTELFVKVNIAENAKYEITSIESKSMLAGTVNGISIAIETLKNSNISHQNKNRGRRKGSSFCERVVLGFTFT
jgi:hypothetical protein